MIVKTEKTNERTRREVSLLPKHARDRKPNFNSTAYYIEEVVRYRSEQEAAEQLKDGYAPLMLEMQLAILISVRAIRGAICLLTGTLLFLLLKLILVL